MTMEMKIVLAFQQLSFLDFAFTVSEVIQVESTYNFTSQHFDEGFYKSNFYQEMIFTVPNGCRIMLTIDYIHTERNYDFVRIGDGGTPGEYMLIEYSGGPEHDAVEVLSNETDMWLTFTTDFSLYYDGFSGYAQLINTTSEGKCSIIYYIG